MTSIGQESRGSYLRRLNGSNDVNESRHNLHWSGQGIDEVCHIGIGLGVKEMLLIYNIQSYSYAGYTEGNDGGLTGLGKEAVNEVMMLRIVCELSHFEPTTTDNVIKFELE